MSSESDEGASAPHRADGRSRALELARCRMRVRRTARASAREVLPDDFGVAAELRRRLEAVVRVSEKIAAAERAARPQPAAACDRLEWLSVLTDDFWTVAKAALDRETTDETLCEDLTELAAAAVAWLNCFDLDPEPA